MSDYNEQEARLQWQRRFAMECNNTAWDLAAREGRSLEEDRQMLATAFASAYHWGAVGLPVNSARADLTIAHVLALLDQGPLALEYARRCLEFCENNPCEDWDLAFAHAEMAHAAAKTGDLTLHSYHYGRARELGEAIEEDEDRQVFLDEFERIPRVAEGV